MLRKDICYYTDGEESKVREDLRIENHELRAGGCGGDWVQNSVCKGPGVGSTYKRLEKK